MVNAFDPSAEICLFDPRPGETKGLVKGWVNSIIITHLYVLVLNMHEIFAAGSNIQPINHDIEFKSTDRSHSSVQANTIKTKTQILSSKKIINTRNVEKREHS